MRIEKVKVAIYLIRSEASNNSVMLRDNRMKRREPLPPAANVLFRRGPSGKLLCGVKGRCKRMDGRPK